MTRRAIVFHHRLIIYVCLLVSVSALLVGGISLLVVDRWCRDLVAERTAGTLLLLRQAGFGETSISRPGNDYHPFREVVGNLSRHQTSSVGTYFSRTADLAVTLVHGLAYYLGFGHAGSDPQPMAAASGGMGTVGAAGAATPVAVPLPPEIAGQLSKFENLEIVAGFDPRNRKYIAWANSANTASNNPLRLLLSRLLISKMGIYSHAGEERASPWTYQAYQAVPGSAGTVWNFFWQWNLTRLFWETILPLWVLSGLVLVLVLAALAWILRSQQRRLMRGIGGLEDSLKEVFLGHYDILFEARDFTLTQHFANIMNQLLYYFNQDMQKRESEHQRDALTGLYTRGYFMSMLEKEIQRSKRYQRPLSFILSDIDHFKRFNDTYGHQMGDKVLSRTAEILRMHTRETDIVARYGGEEIAIILSETGIKEAMLLAERLRHAVEAAQYTYMNQTVHVTISMGTTSCVGGEDDTVAGIIKRSDEALYEAKQSGRNQVRRKI